jgi:mRNA interferase MazF
MVDYVNVVFSTEVENKKKQKENKEIKRGQIWYADLDGIRGSEQGGRRPVLIVQNDIGNAHSPTTIIAVITSKPTKAKIPTHIWLSVTDGFKVNSMVELEQLRTIDKSRLTKYVGQVQKGEQDLIDQAIKISLGLGY